MVAEYTPCPYYAIFGEGRGKKCMAAKPFETKIQDLVYNVDVGIGLRLTKFFLLVLVVLGVMVIYTATQFHGLKEAEAMDYAQLGRNLAVRHHFTTQCIRPITMWGLIEKSSKHNPLFDDHPDILHPPLWPATLAAAFKMSRISFTGENRSGAFPPEQLIIIPLCHLFTLLTGLVVFFLGKKLFDRRIGLLSVVVYFLSDTVLSSSISGLNIPLVTFLVTAAIHAALTAITHSQENQSRISWMFPLGISLVLCILAFLTRYAAIVLVPAIALFVGVSIKDHGWKWATLFIVAFLIAVSPWLARNKMVSGGLLGMAPYTALAGTDAFPEDSLERTLSPQLTAGTIVKSLRNKAISNFAKYYKGDLRTLGDGLFISLFLTAFFYRFVRTPVHLLRWCIAFAMLLLFILAIFFGEATMRLFTIFWPVILIYGFAFFFILLDRLQLRARLFSLAITALFIILATTPLILKFVPPRPGIPYPPYYHPAVMDLCRRLEPNETMCSDMPWATAWYGNRTSLLLPATIDDFYEINDYTKRISGIYFTQLTLNKPWVRNLLMGPDRTWFPIFEGHIPSDFPLQQGTPIPRKTMDQLFLTDRQERFR